MISPKREQDKWPKKIKFGLLLTLWASYKCEDSKSSFHDMSMNYEGTKIVIDLFYGYFSFIH